MRRLLCFGDSNTYGSPPLVTQDDPHGRYDTDTRWTRICARELGAEWDVVEEGLPGRTAQFDDTFLGSHMNGVQGLRVALESHGPIDALTIMLGTNDVKANFAVPPVQITGGIAALLNIALSSVMQARHGGFSVLVICPPPVLETGCLTGVFWGGRERSLALSPLYRELAETYGTGFLDAGAHVEVSKVDGVHWEPEGHATFGRVVAQSVRDLVA